MNTDAIRRFLTVLSSAVKVERGQLYQLVQSTEASYYLRDIHSQHELALLLLSFGYPFNQIGKYYESIYLHRTGQHEKARELLEHVAESAPARYRSKALLSLSAVEAHIGRFEESLRLRLQISSGGVADPVTLVEAQRGVAVLRSLEGDHRAALRDLERLLPMAHIIGQRNHPAYITFLNSYAIELSEANRTTEAEQVANIIGASPLIGQYPEWRETVAEIKAKPKRSSTVAVSYPMLGPAVIRDPRIRAAIDYMKANVSRTVILDEIASAVSLSQTHMSHLFKSETGFPPGEYLIRLRMQTAQKLLASSFLSVKEVMAAVGYDNRSSFLRQFRRYSNTTPTAYRIRARIQR